MKSSIAIAAAVSAATVVQPSLAAARPGHASYLAQVATYRSAQGFSAVVGDKRFTGFFIAKPGACRVTLIVSRADDEQLRQAPQRLEFALGAANVIQISAGGGQALGVACTAEADTVKVASLHRAAAAETAQND